MFFADALTAYLNCAVAALVGAVMLRLVQTDDPPLRRALRDCGRGLLLLGVGLLPAALGPGAAHPAAQLSIALGPLLGVVLVAQGLGQTQGHALPRAWVQALLAALVAGLLATVGLAPDRAPLLLGQAFALGLAGASLLMLWCGRGFITSPRNLIERGMGLSLLLVAASSALRAAYTLAYRGTARVDLLYVPAPVAPFLAALYGVVPLVIATLLLSLVNARLHHLLRSRATTDELTGLLTRRALRELAPAMVEQTHKARRDVAVLMLDLDHFKAINDKHGHATGDKVLRMVAATLTAQLRHDALLARYGGEEFVALLPVDDLPGARRASERLRLAVEGVAWTRNAGLDAPATTSVGVALVGPGESLDSALQRADEALYRAKRDGRNQVQVSLAVA